MNLPYQHLTLFVIVTLISVVVLTIFTEKYLTSTGYENRKNNFRCLVQHLKEKNVTDEYFPTSLNYSISSETNCIEILKKYEVFEDLKRNLSESYKVPLDLCTDISERVICVGGNQSKLVENCFNATKYFGEETPSKENLEIFLEQSKRNCTNFDDCFTCIKGILAANDDYATASLHTIALNITIIEFEVWKYFSVYERVKELVTEADKMKSNAIELCQADGKKCKSFSEK